MSLYTPATEPVVPALVLGQALQLGLTARAGVSWYASAVVGLEPNDTIALDWPTDAAWFEPTPTTEVQLETVSLIDATHHAQFRVIAAEHNDHGDVFRLLLRQSEPWIRSQRRQSVRVPVQIRPRICNVRTAGGWEPVRGTICDLSAGGMLVRCDRDFAPDSNMAVAFSLPLVPEELKLRLAVLHTHPHQGSISVVWDVGCEFNGIVPVQREQIIHFILAQQRR